MAGAGSACAIARATACDPANDRRSAEGWVASCSTTTFAVGDSRVVRGGSDTATFGGADGSSGLGRATVGSSSSGGDDLCAVAGAGSGDAEVAEDFAPPPAKSGLVPISSIEPPASRSASSRSSAACFMTVCSCREPVSFGTSVLGNIGAGDAGPGRGGCAGATDVVAGVGGVLVGASAPWRPAVGCAAGAGGRDDGPATPRPIMVALRASGAAPMPGVVEVRISLAAFMPPSIVSFPGATDTALGGATGGTELPVPSGSASNALPASARVLTSLSMTDLDGSSISMNFTPMPAGRSPLD